MKTIDKKMKLRNQMLSKRQALSEQAIETQAEELANRVIDWLFDKKIDVGDGYLACYCAIRNELPQNHLIAAWKKMGGRVCLPRIDDDKLVFCAVDKETCRLHGRLKVPEPPTFCPEVLPSDIAAMLVPGLAFDFEGFRIGFGGGYYDRFFSRLQAHDRLMLRTIGVGYDFQLVQKVPRAQHDQKVDLVMTPRRTHSLI